MSGWWGSVWRRGSLGKKLEVVSKGEIHRATRVKSQGWGKLFVIEF